MTLEMNSTRRGFLAGAGSLAISFSLFGRAATALADDASGLVRIGAANVATAPESWLVLTEDAITVYSGKVELGTGVQTALTQMVVEELRLTVADVQYVQGDTLLSVSQGGTVGSKSLQQGGIQLRQAAATAFAELRRRAAEKLGADAADLVAEGGRFRVRNKNDNQSVQYSYLLKEGSTVVPLDPAAPLVAPSDYVVVGKEEPRVDLPGKLDATFHFVHDVMPADVLHGRVIRPPGRNSTNPVVSQLARAQAIPGFVSFVQQGRFFGVVATSEWAAARAAAPATGVVVSWTQGQTMIPQASLPTALRDPNNRYRDTVEPNYAADPAPAFADPEATVVEAGYFTPFQMHGSMGASAAVADVRSAPDPETGIRATIYSGTQNVSNLRGAIALLLGIPAAEVRVLYEEASGCYGHNGADDCAADAALLSQAVGKPVRVQWTRQNEHGWEPLGAAQAHDMKGAITDDGITGWLHVNYAPTANSRPAANNAGTLLAGALKGILPASLPTSGVNSSGRNGPVIYDIPAQRVEHKLIKSFETTGSPPGTGAPAAPLRYRIPRTTALRSLGGFSCSFANESFFDELAHAAGRDPLELRIESLASDSRAAAVCEALRPAWAARPAGGNGTGAGVGFQQYEIENAYAAAYVEATVDSATGLVRVTRVVVSHDCGLIVNPDGLRNQIEGNVIQGVSRTLREEVHYTADRVTSVVWAAVAPFNPPPQYEVLRFNEVPVIETILIDRPTEPPLGAGEPTIGAIGGAIGNAVFAATGKRIRSLPFTPARVLQALSS